MLDITPNIPLPYVQFTSASISESGYASYYGSEYDGGQTASGEIFNMNALTAAHPSLPFGTKVKVTNQNNEMSVIVTINDRGPFSEGRIIDLSYAAAKQIDMIDAGIELVTLEVINR